MTFHILGIIIPTDFHSIIFQRGRNLNHQPDNFFKSFLSGFSPCQYMSLQLPFRLVNYLQGPNTTDTGPRPFQAMFSGDPTRHKWLKGRATHNGATECWTAKENMVAPWQRYEKHRKSIGKQWGDSEISTICSMYGIFTYKTGWFLRGKCR